LYTKIEDTLNLKIYFVFGVISYKFLFLNEFFMKKSICLILLNDEQILFKEWN